MGESPWMMVGESPGMMAGDVTTPPLYTSPIMVTMATTPNWYIPLVWRLVMSPDVVIGGKV